MDLEYLPFPVSGAIVVEIKQVITGGTIQLTEWASIVLLNLTSDATLILPECLGNIGKELIIKRLDGTAFTADVLAYPGDTTEISTISNINAQYCAISLAVVSETHSTQVANIGSGGGGGGDSSLTIQDISSTDNVLAWNSLVRVDLTGGTDTTIVLPPCLGNIGKTIIVKRIDAELHELLITSIDDLDITTPAAVNIQNGAITLVVVSDSRVEQVSDLSVAANSRLSIQNIDSTTSALAWNSVIRADLLGDSTLTLPACAGHVGQTITIKRLDAEPFTLTVASGDTLELTTSSTLNSQYGAITLAVVSDSRVEQVSDLTLTALSAYQIQEIAGDGAVLAWNSVVRVDLAGQVDSTITLPSCAGHIGETIIIKRLDADPINLSITSADTLEITNPATVNTQYGSITLVVVSDTRVEQVSDLTANALSAYKIQNISGSDTAIGWNSVIRADILGNSTIDLPSCAGHIGESIIIKRLDAEAYTLTVASGDTLEISTPIHLNTQYGAITLTVVSDTRVEQVADLAAGALTPYTEQYMTATGSVSSWNSIVRIDLDGGADALITLPTALRQTGKTIVLQRVDSASFTITINSSDILHIAKPQTLNSQYGTITLAVVSDGIIEQISELDVNALSYYSVRTVLADANLTDWNSIILLDLAADAVVALPLIANNVGKTIIMKRIDAQPYSLTITSGDTLNITTPLILNSQGGAITLAAVSETTIEQVSYLSTTALDPYTIQSINETDTVLSWNSLVRIDLTGGADAVITLPTCSGHIGKTLVLKRLDADPYTVSITSTDVLDITTSETLNSQYGAITLAVVSDSRVEQVSDLSVAANNRYSIQNVAGTDNVLAWNSIVRADLTNSLDSILTLPACAGHIGKTIIIKRLDADLLTLDVASADALDVSTPLTLNSQYGAITLAVVSDSRVEQVADLSINALVPYTIQNITADATATSWNSIVRADLTGGANTTITLPACAGHIGKTIVIKRLDADPYTVSITSADALDVSTPLTLNSQYGAITLAVVSDSRVEQVNSLSMGGGTPENLDDTFVVKNALDDTKQFALNVGQVSTATTRTFTVPDHDGILPVLMTSTLALGSTVYASTIADNTFLGFDAGINNLASPNFAAGTSALLTNTVGVNNLAIGFNALMDNKTSSNNLGIGVNALLDNIADDNFAIGNDSMHFNTSGTLNLALGADSLYSNTTGSSNIGIGAEALLSNTTGTTNLGIGYKALHDNTTGSTNLAIGASALQTAIIADFNFAIGANALKVNTTGSIGLAIGANALQANTTGSNNLGIGYKALHDNITGSTNLGIGVSALHANLTNNNLGIGYNALLANTTGTPNLAVGASALLANTTGINNTAVGLSALAANITGGSNLAIGPSALLVNTASSNLAIGPSALLANTTGTPNLAIGANALLANTTGSNSMAIGLSALAANTTGLQNIAFGPSSLAANKTGSYNVAIGFNALSIGTAVTANVALCSSALLNNTANHNIGIGFSALSSNTSGTPNLAIGSYSLQSSTTVSNNLGIGYNTLANNTSGTPNLAIGASALAGNITGIHNLAIGSNALLVNTSNYNTAIGSNALQANTTGANNTAIGALTLQANTTSSDNLAIGVSALTNNTASPNLGIGPNALATNTSGSSNLAIGSLAIAANSTGSNNLGIGVLSLRFNTASNNLAIGASALAANTSGTPNLAIGANALDANTTGTNNLAIGIDALGTCITGLQNLAIGANALKVATGNFNTAIGYNTLLATTTGGFNVAIGPAALDANMGGSYNIGIGGDALGANTTGGSNIAIGAQALGSTTTTSSNIAIGFFTLSASTTGLNLIAIGNYAMDANTTGQNSIAIGTDALGANIGGTYNLAIGHNTLAATTNISNNLAIGYKALTVNTTGTPNLAIGYGALVANTTGNSNLAIGLDALKANTTASNNLAIGPNALLVNTTGTPNLAIGAGALDANTTGTNNLAIGLNSLGSNTTASNNLAIGPNALLVNTTGATNLAIGPNALDANTTGSNNLAIGSNSLGANTTGQDNVAIGPNTLLLNTTGGWSVAIGSGALQANTTGTNIAVGSGAMISTTSGGSNTAIGENSLRTATIATHNVAVGQNALFTTTASQLVAVGAGALYNNTTGTNNLAVGYQALYANTTASNNLAIGLNSLGANTTGNSNTAIGASALLTLATGSSNIAIGDGAGNSLTTNDSNNILIGNTGVAGLNQSIRVGSAQTSCFIQGIRGATTGVADAIAVLIDSAGQLGTVSSSIRYKENVAPIDTYDKVLDLNPVSFNYKSDASKTKTFGLIAEEVQHVMPEIVVRKDIDGELVPETVQYHLLVPMLLDVVRKLNARILALEAQVKLIS